MHDSYQPGRSEYRPTRDDYQPIGDGYQAPAGEFAEAARAAGLRRLSRLTWRATQLGALAAVGFATVFARTAPAQTVSNRTTPAPGAKAAAPMASPSPARTRRPQPRRTATRSGRSPQAGTAQPTAQPVASAAPVPTPAPKPTLAPPTTPPAPPPATSAPTPAPTVSSASHGGG